MLAKSAKLQPAAAAGKAAAGAAGCSLRVSAEVAWSTRYNMFRSQVDASALDELRENYAQHFSGLVRAHLAAARPTGG